MAQKPQPEELVRGCIELGVRLRQMLASKLDAHGITPEQHELLILLSRGLRSPKEILSASGRDKTTLSRAVSRAARAGLVVEERSDGDRRRQIIRLTERGSAILEQTHRLLDSTYVEMAAALTPKEQRRLGKISRKMRRALSRQG